MSYISKESLSYTVQKITKTDKLFGPVHGAENDHETLCGKEINECWFILTNVLGEGEVTCKECKKHTFSNKS